MSAGSRIVIAEDEAIIRLDLKELLIEEGYDVIGETGRGDEALELVRRLRPDVAILDIKMPGADGLTVARAVAGEHLCAVLIVTAFSQRELIEQARDAGALAYIVKPFERTDLVPARGRSVQVAPHGGHEPAGPHRRRRPPGHRGGPAPAVNRSSAPGSEHVEVRP
jgi:AmiR/NasT family two-component response regulator